MADKEVLSTRCYLCHHNLRKKVRWFSPNGKHYYSLSWCDKHGWMKGKIRVKKAMMTWFTPSRRRSWSERKRLPP